MNLGVLTASSIAPAIPLAGLQAMGYQFAALPLQLLMRELWVAWRMLADLKNRGGIEQLRLETVPFSELTPSSTFRVPGDRRPGTEHTRCEHSRRLA